MDMKGQEKEMGSRYKMSKIHRINKKEVKRDEKRKESRLSVCPRIFVVLCYHFCLFPGVKKNSFLISSLTHSLFHNELFNLHELAYLLEVCLLFILSYCIVIGRNTKREFNLFEIVKMVLCPRLWSVLEKLRVLLSRMCVLWCLGGILCSSFLLNSFDV